MSFDQMPRTPHSLTMLKRGCGDNWNCVYSSGAGFPPSTVCIYIYIHMSDVQAGSGSSSSSCITPLAISAHLGPARQGLGPPNFAPKVLEALSQSSPPSMDPIQGL